MPIHWNSYRRLDGTIDLLEALKAQENFDSKHSDRAAFYLKSVEDMQPIRSRQVAASILAPWLTPREG